MAGSMKEIKLRIRSVESTMQITKAMELVASSKLRRAKERVEGSRPYFETLYSTLYDIVSADSGFDSPYLVRRDTNRRLYIVIAGDRGLAGGYNSNILKAIEADAEGADYCVLPIGKKAVEHFERRKAAILTTAFAEAGDLSVSDCFEISRLVCQKFLNELKTQCGWGLFDHIKTKSFTGTAVNIENFAYMQDWDLGDIVTTGDSSIGITMNERVTEVEEVYEKGSVTIYPVTGKTKSETLNLEDI